MKKICHNCKHRGDPYRAPTVEKVPIHHCQLPEIQEDWGWGTIKNVFDKCSDFEPRPRQVGG